MTYRNFDIVPTSINVRFSHDDDVLLQEDCTLKYFNESIHLIFDNTQTCDPYRKLNICSKGILQNLFDIEASTETYTISGKISADDLRYGSRNGGLPDLSGYVQVHTLEIQSKELNCFDKASYYFEENEQRYNERRLRIDDSTLTNPGAYGIEQAMQYSIDSQKFDIEVDKTTPAPERDCSTFDEASNTFSEAVSCTHLAISLSSLEYVDHLSREAIMLANFMTGSSFDWTQMCCYFENEISHYRYILPRRTDHPNKVSLQLNHKGTFDIANCFEKNFGQHGKDYFIDNGIYSAIKVYARINNLFDEYFQLRQLAPLENLVRRALKDQEITSQTFKSKTQKGKYFSKIRKTIRELEGVDSFFHEDLSSEKKKKCIEEYAERVFTSVTISLPLKDAISTFLTQKFDATDYKNKNQDLIDSACQLRNKVAHLGWISPDLRVSMGEKTLSDIAFFTRELGQLIILLLLNSEGEFTSFIDEKTTYKLVQNSVYLI